MKNFCFVFAVLVFVTSFVYAQTPNDAPVEWKFYDLPNEELSVELPASVSVSKDSSDKKESPVLYSSSANKTLFYVTSGKENEISVLNDIRNLIKTEKAVEQNVSFGDFTASKYSFADSEDFFQTIVLVKGKKRFYIFHAVGEEKDKPDIERFVSSIKLNSQFIEIPDFQKPQEESEQIVQNTTEAGNGIGSGTGSGNGSGFGNGSGSGTPMQKPNSANQNSPLKILYKAKPPYTNLARYYSIQGRVLLRVMFLANGTIGTLTPVTKLPFGLTNSAKNAAKQIRFEPQINSGTPYTIVKSVEYSFTIY